MMYELARRGLKAAVDAGADEKNVSTLYIKTGL